MLGHLAALWVAFILFTVVFWRDDPAAARRERGAGAVSPVMSSRTTVE
jgi:hypothetical protein